MSLRVTSEKRKKRMVRKASHGQSQVRKEGLCSRRLMQEAERDSREVMWTCDQYISARFSGGSCVSVNARSSLGNWLVSVFSLYLSRIYTNSLFRLRAVIVLSSVLISSQCPLGIGRDKGNPIYSQKMRCENIRWYT